MDDFFLIAQIKAPFGNGGYFSVLSFSDFPERFFRLKNIYIDIFGEKKEFVVDDVVEEKNKIVLKLKNFDSTDDIEFLIGSNIYVDEKNVVELSEDTYFVHDLLDSKVFIETKFFGELKEVIPMPANDVYVVIDKAGKEFLIPAVKEFIESFDAVNKRLYLKPGIDLEFYDAD
ncbi:MAG: ribosome maturation factor RimM [bacterium]